MDKSDMYHLNRWSQMALPVTGQSNIPLHIMDAIEVCALFPPQMFTLNLIMRK